MNAATLRLMRLSEVRECVGLSRSEIYRRVQSGDFPAPVKIGAMASAWPHHEISGWIADRIAERDGKGRTA